MVVRFRIPASHLESLVFSYGPVLEAVLSLHVLHRPGHHALQHEWVRAARRFPVELKREIAAFGFTYEPYLPSFLNPALGPAFPTFEDELARLAATDPTVVALECTRPFTDGPTGPAARDPRLIQRTVVRRRIQERAAARDPATAELMALALDAPDQLLARFIRLLEAYWDAGFRDEWQRIEPLLAQAVTDTGQRLAAEGLYAVFDDLWPDLRVDRAREVVWVERTHEHDVVITADRPFVLTPSIYTWPHLHVECDDPWPLGLVYPTPAVRRGARPPLPPDRLVRLLRTLADDTRLRALRLLATQPRSTQELAPLLGITEGALSKHLRLLADIGLLETKREGYYVLYRLVDAQLAHLAPALQQFLRGSQASPTARTPSTAPASHERSAPR